MNDKIPDIEIRSKKVRNIIGQIPSYLIRASFSIAFVIFAMLIVALYFFEYDYVIKTSATIVPKSDSTIKIKVNIPANQIERIKTGQLIIISFDNVPNMSGQSIQLNNKGVISPSIDIMPSGGFYIMNFTVKNPVFCEKFSFLIKEPLTLSAEIHTGKERIFNKILKFIAK